MRGLVMSIPSFFLASRVNQSIWDLRFEIEEIEEMEESDLTDKPGGLVMSMQSVFLASRMNPEVPNQIAWLSNSSVREWRRSAIIKG